MEKHLIFDFDGTIANTYDLTVEICTDILKRYKINLDDKEATKIGLRRYITKTKFPIWAIPTATAELRRRLYLRIDEIKLYPDMSLVLKELAKNYSLLIMASNTLENVERILNNAGVRELFDYIETGVSLFGKHRVLKKIYKKFGINSKDATYLCDEDRDVQAAKKINTNVIAVVWGYNIEELLLAQNPNCIAREPKQLLEILKC